VEGWSGGAAGERGGGAAGMSTLFGFRNKKTRLAKSTPFSVVFAAISGRDTGCSNRLFIADGGSDMLRPFTVLLLCGLLALPRFVLALNQPASDPEALALASQSVTALTGGTTISDVTLSGNVTRTAGSDVQTGPATLYGKGQNESRLNLNLSGGQRTEIRNYANSSPQGEWMASDGSPNAFAQFNCLTDAVWFFPALSSLASASDPNQTLSYVGLEMLNGASVQHLRSIWFRQPISQTDFYLDATTLLPVSISLNVHADDDSSINIPVQVQFSNYQDVNGVFVPYHIQQVLNGSLLLDFTVSATAFNSGLSDSLFTIQ